MIWLGTIRVKGLQEGGGVLFSIVTLNMAPFLQVIQEWRVPNEQRIGLISIDDSTKN